MNNEFMQSAVKTILGILVLTIGMQISVFGQVVEKQERNERGIVGTWQTSVTPRNCQTGEPVAPAFQGILTFNDGETLTGTSTAVTSVYGVWKDVRGRRNYSFAFLSLRYSPTGTFIGTQKVRQTAEIGANGDSFTTTGTIEILDANGATIGTGCATSTGTRFE